MRMVPMSPNSLITLTCPVLNVPKKIFFFSTLLGMFPIFRRKFDCFLHYFVLYLGMAPYTFISVQTGSFLSQLNTFDDLFTWRTFLTLALIASVAGSTGLIVARVRRRIPQTVI